MPENRYLLTNAQIVTPDRVIAGGSVAIEGERIVDVSERTYPAAPDVVDLDGRFVLPGLIDLHADNIEREVAPRPGADLDPAFALAAYDRKLAAAGITTQFHGIYFANKAGFGRSVEHGVAMAEAVHAFQDAPHRLVDHNILHRLDLRTPGALDALLSVIGRSSPALISLNEHIPGQGQYGDLAAMRRSIRPSLGSNATDADVEAEIVRRMGHVAATDALAHETLTRVAAESVRRGIVLASHDDDSPERVDQMHALGCTIAEFPVSLAAAERAREIGMHIAAGAPNVVRGRSLAGNTSAIDLVARGLVDLLVADYHAPSLLMAVFRIADAGILDLAAAARLVTATPAEAVGLMDRGEIAVGRRADLLVVDRHGGIPTVEATIVAGVPRALLGAAAGALVRAGVVA